MSKSNHYVPILKWKRAEQRALMELEEKNKSILTPLIELVMPTVSLYNVKDKNKIKKTQGEQFAEIVQKFKEKRIKEIPEEILESWGTSPVFLDFSLLYEDQFTTQLKVNSLNKIIPAGMDIGLRIIPTFNLNDDQEIKEAVCLLSKKYNQGVCLRIAPSDLLNTERLNKKIKTFLSDFSLSIKNIDILIDIKEIKENGGQYLQFINASQQIDNLMEWRNFIFAGGAFPENLSGCKIDDPKPIPRFDWQNWLHFTQIKKLKRCPIFADYTIRNPIFKETLQYYSSTTSIKYTLEKDWFIMKGKVREFGLYLVNAKLLVEDTEYFYGEEFSWGDKNIAQKAKHYYQYLKDNPIKGTGRAEDWIAWGINHHLVLVANQIANLP
ncbi:MAG: beta family protein [Patescibacteria group bacterium]|nr:beta family protein [Patescibacteria group bacterium]